MRRLEKDIAKQCENLEAFEHQFHAFEKKQFDDQLAAASRVVQDTH